MRIYFDAWVRALFSFSFDVDSEAWSKNGGLQNDQRSGSIFASLLDRNECSRDFSPWLGLYRLVNWKKSVTVFVFCFFQLLCRKVSGHGSVFQRRKENDRERMVLDRIPPYGQSRLKWRSNCCNWDSPFHFYRRKNNNYYYYVFFVDSARLIFLDWITYDYTTGLILLAKTEIFFDDAPCALKRSEKRGRQNTALLTISFWLQVRHLQSDIFIPVAQHYE